jgi:undecaprenyl-diphosphatase
MRARDAALVGLIHGPAELVPVSSSAHVALLLRSEDRVVETSMHLGTAAALVWRHWDDVRPRSFGVHLIAGAIPSVVGIALRERRGSLPAGLLAGALALAWADSARTVRTFPPYSGVCPNGSRNPLRGPARRRSSPTPLDAVFLGLAQACALIPGVSRNGATVAVARARGFEREEAQRLSREIGLPVTLGAAAYTLARERPKNLKPLIVGAAASFLATLTCLPLLPRVDRAPLWPFALYRTLLALALMGRSAR